MTKIIVRCAITWPLLLICSEFWGWPYTCGGRAGHQRGHTHVTCYWVGWGGLAGLGYTRCHLWVWTLPLYRNTGTTRTSRTIYTCRISLMLTIRKGSYSSCTCFLLCCYPLWWTEGWPLAWPQGKATWGPDSRPHSCFCYPWPVEKVLILIKYIQDTSGIWPN